MENRDNFAPNIPQQGFFGHPKGLFTLFTTEFWERFSYYGMRAILVYFMYFEVTRGGLGLSPTLATAIMSIYGSLVYMSSVIGGWLADRIFGTSRAVFYGGVLIMLGHIALAIPSGISMFFLSMCLIVIGTGLLKPNVSTMVGSLYAPQDNRRDSGFSLFYMGINLGGFLSPIVVGTIAGENFHLGFGIAAIGMFFGLLVFLFTGKENLGSIGKDIVNPLQPEEKRKVFMHIALGLLIIIGVVGYLALQNLLSFDLFINGVGVLGIIIPIVYFTAMFKSPKTTKDERSRLIAYIPLFLSSVVFWAIQEQGSTILAIFAEKRTQLNIFGIHLNPAFFQSLNPLFIISLAPVFAVLWVKLGKHQLCVPTKFSLGLVFAGLSFLLLIIPLYFDGAAVLVNPIWLVLSNLFVVIGELCLSPVGLSASTKLAPAAFTAQTMSLWFLSNSAGQAINAQIAKFYTDETEILYFALNGGVAIFLGLIIFACAPKIRSYMKGIS